MGSSRENELSKLFQTSPATLAVGTMDGKLVEVNDAYAGLFGYASGEMIGKTIAELGIIPDEELRRLLSLGGAPGPAMREVRVAMKTRRGRVLDVLMSADVVSFGGACRRVATLVDLTEHNRVAEERRKVHEDLLRTAQLESVGRLAGDVAHDFDDILAAMAGYANLLLRDMPAGDPGRSHLTKIVGLADRAAGLVDRLLAFGQRRVLSPRLVDLNACVRRAAAAIDGHAGGAGVEVTMDLVAAPCWVNVDDAELERALVAMACDPSNGMPNAGRISFETDIETPGPGFAARHPQMKLGPVARLTVHDAGGRAEPLVEYPPLGLGLASAYGFVRQSGGGVEIDGRPGSGTAVRIYLPVAASAA